MRLFALKLILSHRQKYEPRSKSFIFDIHPKYLSYQTQSQHTSFSVKMWKETSVMEHLFLDWPQTICETMFLLCSTIFEWYSNTIKWNGTLGDTIYNRDVWIGHRIELFVIQCLRHVENHRVFSYRIVCDTWSPESTQNRPKSVFYILLLRKSWSLQFG